MKRAILIYNPVAGHRPRKREREIQAVAAVLRAASVTVQLAPTSGPGAAGDLARAAARQGDELILVCGGDGTINEVVNGIVPSNAPLGILPGGTANILANELGLPPNPVRAARQLSFWSPRRIALGRASWPASGQPGAQPAERGQRYFLSVAGIGFDAYIVHALSTRFKRSLGAGAYVLEALRQVLRYPFPQFTCRVDESEFQATFAVVQRTCRYAGWLHLAPRANLFEPRLTLCLFKSSDRARYFVYAAAVLLRQHLRLGDVHLLEAHKVVCSSGDSVSAIYFELDGELAGQLPATFDIVPDALTLLVPQKELPVER